MAQSALQKRRRFDREAKLESRVFCGYELCCLDFGRMLYPRAGGEPIRFRRIPGFAGNFTAHRRRRSKSVIGRPSVADD